VTALSRRTVLRGLGASVALPLLDAMVPTRRVSAATDRKKIRLVCIEMVHGSAGSSAIGVKKNLWAPAAIGSGFDLSPTSLRSLEPFRDHLTSGAVSRLETRPRTTPLATAAAAVPTSAGIFDLSTRPL